VVVLSAQPAVEEGGDVGIFGRDGCGGVDGADVAGDETLRQAELAGDLGDQRYRVFVGILAVGATQGEVQVPAAGVGPEGFPRRDGVVVGSGSPMNKGWLKPRRSPGVMLY
jgi:hypothetical protein